MTLDPLRADSPTCPTCGGALPADLAQDFCPVCELRGALAEGMDHPPLPPLEDDGPELPQSFGDYELLEEIARGGMGVVYRARQINLNRIVAVKLLPLGALSSPAFVKRFRAEASAAASLQHPNIVTVYEVGVHHGQHYLVMNFVNGPPFSRLVVPGPLPARRAAGYLKTVAEAVHHAHERGILHRDLKPSNVLIDENDQPLVTDFGLAKRLDGESSLTLSGHVLGSPNYMSPEQASSDHGRVTRRTDIYGLGATLYHLLTGRPPFQAATLNEAIQQVLHNEPAPPRLLNPSVPRDLETICLKCVEKEPDKRYETADAVAQELERFLNGQPVLARPMSYAGKAWRWCRRRPLLAGLSTALILTMAAGMVGVLWQWQRAVAAERQALQERDGAELLAAEAAVERGQTKLEAGDSWGLFDLVEAYRLAEHHPAFQQTVGRRWATWHAEWDRRTIAVRPVPGIPSPDHLQSATLTDWPPLNNSREVNIVDTLTGTRMAGPMRHESNAKGGAFSSDGKLLATVTERGVIHLWNCRTGQPFRAPCETGIPELNRISFSEDGRFLVVFALAGSIEGAPPKMAALLRLDQKQATVQLLPHHYPVRKAQFSPNGDLLAVLCPPDLQLWRTSDFHPAGEPIAVSLSGLLQFNVDGTLLAFNRVGSGGTGLLNPRTGHVLQTLPTGRDRTTTASFSHDGNLLATFDGDLHLRLWRRSSVDQSYATQRMEARMYGRLSFNRDDSMLAVGDTAGKVRVLRTSDGQTIRTLQVLPYAGADFLSNGVLAASASGEAIFWDLAASPLPWSALPEDALARSFAFDRSGAVLAVGGEHELRLWSMQTSPRLQRLVRMPGRVLALAFSAVEDQFVAFTDDGSLTLIDPRTGATKVMRHIDRGYRMSARLSPDAGKLTLFDSDVVFVVDTQTPAITRLSNEGGNLSVAFGPDSKKLAIGMASWKVGRYDLSAQANEPMGLPPKFAGSVKGVAYHPNGKVLAVNLENHVIRLYNLEENHPAFSAYESSLARVDLFCFSPDGNLLAMAGPRSDGGHGVELWHVDLQRGLFRGASILSCEHKIWSMVFSPDNQTLVTGGLGATRLWNLPREPKSLWELQWRTRAALGFRSDEQGQPVYRADPTTKDVEKIRARLTQEPASAVTPVDAALKLSPTQAVTALQTLVDENPEANVYRELQSRLHSELMAANGAQGLWNEALTHADEAIRLGGDDVLTQALRALLLLQVGDIEGYRASCQSMTKRYESCNDPSVLETVASAVTLQPGALDDYDELVEHFRRLVPLVGNRGNPTDRFFLGAVLVQAGRYAEAARELEQVNRDQEANEGFDPIELKFLLATCHAHLGHEEMAREWFDAAVAETQSVFGPDQETTHVPWWLKPILVFRQKDAEAALRTLAPLSTRPD